MNGLTLLIIGAPALLFAYAGKKAQKQAPKVKTERTPDWQFPPKWQPPVAKTGEGR